MRASSPLEMVQEQGGYAPSEVDLWESASLDYPGREEMEMFDDIEEVGDDVPLEHAQRKFSFSNWPVTAWMFFF